MRILIISALLLSLFGTSRVMAQEGGGGSAGGSEISLYLGSMLPNQIDGVTEILPVFGGRFGLSTASLGVIEAGLANSRAEGVDFTTLSVSLRADMPAIDQFVAILYGGLDFSYYRPAGAENRQSETGLHLGTGLMVHMSDTLWLRTDLKFSAQPGTSLSILAGLVFKAR